MRVVCGEILWLVQDSNVDFKSVCQIKHFEND